MNAENYQWFLMGAALVGAVWVVTRLLRSFAPKDDSNFGRVEHAYELSRHPLYDTRDTPRQSAQREPSPPAEPQPPEVQPPDIEVPYGLDSRPLPERDDIDHLLPPQIGRFQRSAPRGDVYELTYAEYTDGLDQICMSVAVCKSPEIARSGIGTAQLESADVTEFVETSSIATEPSFLKSRINNLRMGSTGQFTSFMWNRDRFYFSADAKTSDLLDSFMAIFPY